MGEETPIRRVRLCEADEFWWLNFSRNNNIRYSIYYTVPDLEGQVVHAYPLIGWERVTSSGAYPHTPPYTHPYKPLATAHLSNRNVLKNGTH